MLVQRDTVDGNIDLHVWVFVSERVIDVDVWKSQRQRWFPLKKAAVAWRWDDGRERVRDDVRSVCRFNWIDGPHLLNRFVGCYVCMCNLKPFDPTA